MNLQSFKNIGAFVLLVSLGWSPLLYAGPDVQTLKKYHASEMTQADRTPDDPQCKKMLSTHLHPKSLRAWSIPDDCRKLATRPYKDVNNKEHQHLRVKGIPIS